MQHEAAAKVAEVGVMLQVEVRSGHVDVALISTHNCSPASQALSHGLHPTAAAAVGAQTLFWSYTTIKQLLHSLTTIKQPSSKQLASTHLD
jgi:hypothetical protein